jgi:ABC-type Co2+ transport system permease subunit
VGGGRCRRAIAIGVLLLVTGDGAVMVLAGVAAAIAGVYLLLVQAQRLEFDGEAVRRRSLVRPGTVAWSEVTEAKVGQRFVRSARRGFVATAGRTHPQHGRWRPPGQGPATRPSPSS